MSWGDAVEAIGYDRSVIFRCLKGTYTGSWPNVARSIKQYRRIAEQRGTIQVNEWIPNNIVRMISGGLDYALANNSITMIIGESRMGKTVAAKMWRAENNHGTTVFVTAPPYGGTKYFMRRIADSVGVNKNGSMSQVLDGISRSFNKNRMLIVDEAHRLLPGDRRSMPVSLEVLRDIHDTTGCALSLIATQRLDDELKKSDYQYEQILGRIGMPIRLPRMLKEDDWMPIVTQYVPEPSDEVKTCCHQIANAQGRLGILVETLKVAARIAKSAKSSVKDEHIIKAIRIRRQMMGQHPS